MAVFTIEYVTRLAVCPKIRAFVLAPLNIIDLLAIVPCKRCLHRSMPVGICVDLRRAMLVNSPSADYITLFVAVAVQIAPWEQTSSGGGSGLVQAGMVLRAVRFAH